MMWIKIKVSKIMYNHSVFLLILIFIVHNSSAKNYTNFTLYRGIPVNDSHLRFFESLPDFYDVDFWRHPGMKNMPVDFVISPNDKKSFLRSADKNGLYVTTILENVQDAFDKQTVKSYIRRRTDSFDWQNYFKVADIYSWLRDLSAIYPKQLKVWSIGKTYEDRDIMVARVILDPAKVRSKIIVEGGIHAREWISPAFVTYLLDQILHSQHSKNKLLKKLAPAHEWYFVPILNPDGYEYTYTNDRLWRKNRHNENLGVDLNRNFDVDFGTVGISRIPKSGVYCGESAFSEKESRAMRDFVKSKSNNLEFYFGFHAYGQFIILPYAHTKEHLDNFDEVKIMAEVAAEKIEKRYGIKYTHGTAFDTVGYLSSGGSGCWVKKTFRTPFVVTFELRDEGKYGFALPPDQIIPTCQETLDGILSLVDQGTSMPKILYKNLINSSGHSTTSSICVLFIMLIIIIGHLICI